VVLQKTLESPLDCKKIQPVHPKGVLGVHWKDWCWSRNSNTLATWCEELTHLKRPWCWERLRAGGEGDDRGWDGWMASPIQWTWVWVDSGSWWWTGRPGVLQFMGSQRVRHDWATELNWTYLQVPETGMCAVLVGCHSAFHLHKTWFFRHSQECGACKFAECLRLLSLFTLYVYLWFSQILWDPKYYCLAFVVRRSLSFVNDRLELAWREWPYIRSVQNLKRCQAHFLLKVFGEGYEVNHWELDDEVKLFSRSLVSDSLPPRGLQHTRFPCPTPTPGVYSNSCPLSRWCHPTIIPCRSLLLLPSVFPSIRIFSNESALRIRWLKYWSFSFNISPSSAYSGLISFRMDWLDLLAVQGTLKSSPTQFKSINPWVLSFLYSPSLTSIHDYWKTTALTRGTFSYLASICCSMSSSNCCFLTCIQISQEAGQVVSYSHLFQNFPVYCDPHSQRFWHSQWSRTRCFSGTLLLFRWSRGCWQFDLWFLCLF